jgi:hypothetical protein
VVVVSMTDRTGLFGNLSEEKVAEFIRNHIASRLSGEASQAAEYERPHPDLAVSIVAWRDFSREFTSDWDLVFLWKMSIDAVQDAPASRRDAIVSHLLMYEFLDCNNGAVRPKGREQAIISSWITSDAENQFYANLAEDLNRTWPSTSMPN